MYMSLISLNGATNIYQGERVYENIQELIERRLRFLVLAEVEYVEYSS